MFSADVTRGVSVRHYLKWPAYALPRVLCLGFSSIIPTLFFCHANIARNAFRHIRLAHPSKLNSDIIAPGPFCRCCMAPIKRGKRIGKQRDRVLYQSLAIWLRCTKAEFPIFFLGGNEDGLSTCGEI